MDTKFLFPSKFKLLGWILFIPALIGIIAVIWLKIDVDSFPEVPVLAIIDNPFLSDPKYFTVIQNPILDEVLLVTMIIGGILLGFSRTTDEDEYISKIRYESLIWAMYFNFALMLFATIFIYGVIYLHFLMANMFSMLLFFNIRFHLKLYQLNKASDDE